MLSNAYEKEKRFCQGKYSYPCSRLLQLQVFQNNLGTGLSPRLYGFWGKMPESSFDGSISLYRPALLRFSGQGNGGKRMKSRIILVQPPFVQLNSPYPAPYYLKSFLEKRGFQVQILDHSITLFGKIFSKTGLELIFSDVLRSFDASDKDSLCIIERFLSEKELWLASIDRLIGFLRGRDPEWGHLLALANGSVPGGPRTDAFLAERGGEFSPDEAKLFATLLLSDLADFITCTLDKGFSLIRYNPVMKGSLESGYRDFAAVRESLRSGEHGAYIMNRFYRPLLEEEWEKLETGGHTAVSSPNISASGGNEPSSADSPVLLGLTIPFPGCLAPALVCADSAKKRFGASVRTVAGGGFVNTELRFLDTPDFFDYFDYVSFDRGYGSLVSILEHMEAGEKSGETLYKTMYRFQGRVFAAPDIAACEKPAVQVIAEDEAVRTIFPDYSGVDFSRYLYPVDDANPMHRLWSDGHWLKAYLAHGCYWHSCAFCDVTLDYIRNFIRVDPAAVFSHLKEQAERSGCRGIHFCDEAAPASSLLEFALLNREAGLPLSFWGNIRFEKDFDPDTASILAAGGLTGVSAGLEVVTESGLKRLGKGIDLEKAVCACAAFKEAGILTHAYLIYGYWDQDEQEIIDSAEILRQFFSNGLLDSAFWHKFILTRHSRIFAEKQKGLHPGLRIKDPGLCPCQGGTFALNDLSFEGEEKYDKYSSALERLLGSWMSGETETPVKAAFPSKVKSPSVSPGLVTGLLDKYARDRDMGRAAHPSVFTAVFTDSLIAPLAATEENRTATIPAQGGKVLFLGSVPRLRQEGKNVNLFWRWRLTDRELKAGAGAEKIAALLEAASTGKGMDAAEFYSSLEEISGTAEAKKIWKRLRESGLALVKQYSF